jgi:hypothetical protein
MHGMRFSLEMRDWGEKFKIHKCRKGILKIINPCLRIQRQVYPLSKYTISSRKIHFLPIFLARIFFP